MSNDHVDKRVHRPTGEDSPRRRFLRRATTATAGLGAVGIAVPFIGSMTPSERAKAAGAPVEIDISELKPGQMIVQAWRGKPVWVLKRTPEMIAAMKNGLDLLADPDSAKSEQPEYTQNDLRSVKEDIVVLLGVCTHLGCAPVDEFESGSVDADWLGGFFCPCHGSKFDFAGRVYKSVPAPTNLPIPPYRFADDNTLVIGENPATA